MSVLRIRSETAFGDSEGFGWKIAISAEFRHDLATAALARE